MISTSEREFSQPRSNSGRIRFRINTIGKCLNPPLLQPSPAVWFKYKVRLRSLAMVSNHSRRRKTLNSRSVRVLIKLGVHLKFRSIVRIRKWIVEQSKNRTIRLSSCLTYVY